MKTDLTARPCKPLMFISMFDTTVLVMASQNGKLWANDIAMRCETNRPISVANRLGCHLNLCKKVV